MDNTMLRETADCVEQRKAEGAKIVEMKQAGCIAEIRKCRKNIRGFNGR